MHFGIFQNIQWTDGRDQKSMFDDAIEQALIAEQLGFESAYWVEHHWTRHGILSSTLGLLAYLAGRTSTIRLGTAVLVLPFHNPARLVEEAATVDILSNGRLELGVGRGFPWLEYNTFNIPWEESAERHEEALEFILRAWREPGRFDHHGKYWTFNNVSVEPHPLQKPHPPVWAGAASPESALRVGRLGLKLQMSSGMTFPKIPEMLAAYRAGLAENGHAFSSDNVLLARATHIEATREKAWQVAQPHFDWFRRTVGTIVRPPSEPPINTEPFAPNLTHPIGRAGGDDVGHFFCSPDEAVTALEDLSSMGVGHVIFQGNWGGIAQEDAVRSLTLIAREVMPHFQRAAAK